MIVAEIEAIKEEISYLRLWMGVSLATWISLLSWVFSISQANITNKAIFSIILLLILLAGIIALHKKILQKIKFLRGD